MPKRGGAIIRGSAIFGGNTVFVITFGSITFKLYILFVASPINSRNISYNTKGIVDTIIPPHSCRFKLAADEGLVAFLM